jgi:hypothetical protein
VGLGIASAIGEMLETGHWALLDRLRAEADPEIEAINMQSR